VFEGNSTSCIIQCGKLCDKANDSISLIERWETIKQKALLWSDLDKFGNVYATVDWDNGPAGQCVHDLSRLTLCNSNKLEQAKKRHTQKDLTKLSLSAHLSLMFVPLLKFQL